jgi:hypothetical protein
VVVAAVGLDLLTFASGSFEQQFMSGAELNARVKESKISSLFVWAR